MAISNERLVWGCIDGYYEAHPPEIISDVPELLMKRCREWDPTIAAWPEEEVLRWCRTWLAQ